MAPSLKRIHVAEQKYVLLDHRALPPEEQPVWVLAVPGNAAFAALCDDFVSLPNGANLAAVERFLVRLENHPDAATVGAFGTPARKAFVESLAFGIIIELAREITGLAVLSETDRKNSDSPSASSATTGGTDAAAGSTPEPTT